MRSLMITSGAAAALLVGCGSTPTTFEPTERASAITSEGYTAAEYDLYTDVGSIGDALVYSQGTKRALIDGVERTVVHVGFEIENNSDRPLRLDRNTLRLDSADLERRILTDIRPVRVDGPQTIPAGEVAKFQAYFALPAQVSSGDIEGFRVRWRVEGPDVKYSQRTPFVEREQYYYYTPYYDPFMYGVYYDPFYRPVTIREYPYRHPWYF